MKKLFLYLILVLTLSCSSAGALEDPWNSLRLEYDGKVSQARYAPPAEQKDPWAMLRSVYLPFSPEDEIRAMTDPEHHRRFAERFNSKLKPYDSYIHMASETFNIPEAILRSLIMAESGGNPFASAGATSAKGLTQTINSTFNESRKGLRKIGIQIKNSPFDPEASIMAGAYYLNQMVDKCIQDGKVTRFDRSLIASWRYPLEYYYAGPGNGVKSANKIYVFSNGEHRVIDKRSYSRKIQAWAQILAT